MAKVFPFKPYRYAPSAGPIADLVTQPYDKISPEMQARYLARSPYNFVRVILGERTPRDSESDNVYTRSTASFNSWIAEGVLKQDAEPSFYAYFQEFTDPDTGERLVRKGFVGLGQLEEYSAGIVHRHEQTLSGPKKDRLELLRHTRAHLEQIFMLYPDPAGAVDSILDAASAGAPDAEVADEYGAIHRLWRIASSGEVARIQELMADKKLVIADGHHRYETALNYSRESPLEDARRMMITFVNMNSPGLRILATHRVVRNLENFDAGGLLRRLAGLGSLRTVGADEARNALARSVPGSILMGVALAGDPAVHILEAPRGEGVLDVVFLHERVLAGALGIGEEAVREERYLKYVRGIDNAIAEVSAHGAQAAFLLQPTKIEEVAEISFGGGVMPQKSTDFYPKLLSGLTIYKLEK
jgi:uncharacterized protein (DUF1015 family)